ncbi:CaiB/BaiF CoA-transferase family protein [Allohahella marinimesophila]|uniref:CoA transferase n=1 Tax=Allohahella marinimesophila TaxID=1054972 RepID=A0ABP7NLD1_9GAMM
MAQGKTGFRLLEGLKILDFSTLLPGPCATMMLADLGADVLRIESPTRPDFLRLLPPRQGDGSAAHAYLNRGKRSLALDLKKPGAVSVVKKLLEAYDIIVEQFRPGVMDRFGLGYQALSEQWPELIYCSITGYGQYGQFSQRAGHDINYLGLAGISSYSGHASEGPAVSGIQIADVAGGSHQAVMNLLAAVIHRQRTGAGVHLDVSMTDAALTLNHMSMAAVLAGGAVPDLESDALNGAGAYNYFETADGRYMSAGALEPQFAQALCAALDIRQLVPTMVSQRPEDRTKSRSALRDIFLTRTQADWIKVFAEVDACVEPVLTLDETARHSLFEEREMFVEVEDRTSGNLSRQLAPAVVMQQGEDRGRPQPAYTGAALGEDTLAVLKAHGLAEEEIRALETEGVFGPRGLKQD